MRIAFNTFLPVWPVVSDPPAKTTKAWELVAHVLRDTRIDEQTQAARQARRAAAGFNKIAAHNAGWRLQFRFADYVLWSGMCGSLDHDTRSL